MQNIKAIKIIKKMLFFCAGIFFILGIYYPFGKAITTQIYFTRFEMYFVEFMIFVGSLNFLFLFFNSIILKIIHIFLNGIVIIWLVTYMQNIFELNGTIEIGAYFFMISWFFMLMGYILTFKNLKIKK